MQVFFPTSSSNAADIGASIYIDMKSQIEKKNTPQHASRLNRIVLGVAFLWLVTSVLILVLSATGSARPGHEPKNDHTRKDLHHQLYAHLGYQPTARASLYVDQFIF